jgi:hypothetical protein
VPYGDSGKRFEYRLTLEGARPAACLVGHGGMGRQVGCCGQHPPPQLSDQNGDPVELRVVNTRTGRRVPRYTVRMLPTKGATDPNMVPPKDIRSRATRQHA